MSKFCLFLCIIGFINISHAQISKSSSEHKSSPQFSYLTTSLTYASNTAYFGRTFGLKTPLTGIDFTYTTTKKLWASFSAFSYYKEPSYEFDFALGYDKKFNDYFDAGLSVYHFEFPSSSTVPNSISSNLISGYLGLDIRNFHSTLSTGYMFGASNDFYVSFVNSLYFEYDSIGRSSNSISIEPKAGITLGTRQFATTTEVQNITEKGNKGKGNGKGKNNNPVSTPKSTTIVKNQFLPLYCDFSVPITYYLRSFDFEIKPRLLIPLNLTADENSGPAFILNAAVYFNLSFQKKLKK